VIIGAIASVLAIEGALFIERKLRIDDPVGAGAIHGLGGAWGLLAVGIFANGRYGEGLNGVAGPVQASWQEMQGNCSISHRDCCQYSLGSSLLCLRALVHRKDCWYQGTHE